MSRYLKISGDRQSGKTHQMLRMAVDAAQAGRRVHYFCGSINKAKNALARAGVTVDQDAVKAVYRSADNLRIEMLGGGCIAFHTGRTGLSGRGATADDLFLDDVESYAKHVPAFLPIVIGSPDPTITESELTQ